MIPRFTLPATNIAENRPYQKENHLPSTNFQVLFCCYFQGAYYPKVEAWNLNHLNPLLLESHLPTVIFCFQKLRVCRMLKRMKKVDFKISLSPSRMTRGHGIKCWKKHMNKHFRFISIKTVGSTPHPVTVSTRFTTVLPGNPYKPLPLWLGKG